MIYVVIAAAFALSPMSALSQTNCQTLAETRDIYSSSVADISTEPQDLSISAANTDSSTILKSQAVETTSVNDAYSFHASQLIVPGALIFLGVAGTCDGKLTLNDEIDDAFGYHSSYGHADDFLRFVPSLAHIGIGFIDPRHASHSTTDRLLMSATAHAISLGTAFTLKHTVSSRRPDGTDDHSFPSGHVTWAFTGAELVRLEYGNTYGTAAYIVAGAVGIMRLRNHRHWFSDVLAGAGIGILGARAANWLLPLERRILGLNADKQSAVFSIAPSYSPTGRSAMVCINIIF